MLIRIVQYIYIVYNPKSDNHIFSIHAATDFTVLLFVSGLLIIRSVICLRHYLSTQTNRNVLFSTSLKLRMTVYAFLISKNPFQSWFLLRSVFRHWYGERLELCLNNAYSSSNEKRRLLEIRRRE